MLLAATKSPIEIAIWAGGLIILVIGLGLVILALRRTMLSKGSDGTAEAGLFESLREMKNRGEITPEEYETAKRNMVARVAGANHGPVGVESSAAKKSKGAATPKGAGEVRARPGFDLTGRPLPKGESPPGNKE